MVNIILSVAFFILALSSVLLRRGYKQYSPKEAKFLSRNGDKLALKAQKVTVYQESLSAVLTILISLFLLLALLFLRNLSLGIFVGLSIVYLLIIFGCQKEFKRYTNFLIKYCSSLLAFLLYYLDSSFKLLLKFFNIKFQPPNLVFDKQDLLKFLERQGKNSTNRIDLFDLEFLKNALKLSDLKIKDICVKWSKVKRFKHDETIGPILLDEIYKSKQTVFPVMNDQKSIIGVLDSNNLKLEDNIKIEHYMSNKVYFINEKASFLELIEGFYKTKSNIFIVVDQASKYSGIISYLEIFKALRTSYVESDKDSFFINPDIKE